MPVNTQLVRNGQPVEIKHGWNLWHVGALQAAREAENPGEKVPFFPDGSYTFKQAHLYYCDESEVYGDGEKGVRYELRVEPGDIYSAWRGF